MNDTTVYRECIENLLIGLECENIDEFMSRLSPKNCLKLGEAYSFAVKKKLRNMDGQKRVAFTRSELHAHFLHIGSFFEKRMIRSDILFNYLYKIYGEEVGG